MELNIFIIGLSLKKNIFVNKLKPYAETNFEISLQFELINNDAY